MALQASNILPVQSHNPTKIWPRLETCRLSSRGNCGVWGKQASKRCEKSIHNHVSYTHKSWKGIGDHASNSCPSHSTLCLTVHSVVHENSCLLLRSKRWIDRTIRHTVALGCFEPDGRGLIKLEWSPRYWGMSGWQLAMNPASHQLLAPTLRSERV